MLIFRIIRDDAVLQQLLIRQQLRAVHEGSPQRTLTVADDVVHELRKSVPDQFLRLIAA